MTTVAQEDRLVAARALTAALARAGLTPGGLAAAAGVSRSLVQDYLAARRQPSVPQLLRLLRAAGVDAAALLAPPPPSDVLVMRREQVRAAVARHGGREVRVFGSVARGEDGVQSDVNLLVQLPGEPGLLEVVALEQELTDILGVPVDVVVEDSATPPQVLHEARVL